MGLLLKKLFLDNKKVCPSYGYISETRHLSDTYFVIIVIIKLFDRFARGRLLPPARRHETARKVLMEAFNSCHPHAKAIVE